MFRMQFREMPDRIEIRVEGRFVREFAKHAQLLIAQSAAPSRFVVDLSEVSYIDEPGEQVLIWLKKIGVRFTADSLYSRDVCERLQLPMHGPSSVTSRYPRHTADRHSHRAVATSNSEPPIAEETPGPPSNVGSSGLAAIFSACDRIGTSK